MCICMYIYTYVYIYVCIYTLYIVFRRFEHPPSTPSIDSSPYMSISPLPSPIFFVFFLNPLLLARLFRQCCANEMRDRHKNKLMW